MAFLPCLSRSAPVVADRSCATDTDPFFLITRFRIEVKNVRTIRDAGPGDYTWVISPSDSIGVVATGKTANIAMLKRTLAMQFSSGLRAHGDSIDVDKGAATDGQRNAGNENSLRRVVQ